MAAGRDTHEKAEPNNRISQAHYPAIIPTNVKGEIKGDVLGKADTGKTVFLCVFDRII